MTSEAIKSIARDSLINLRQGVRLVFFRHLDTGNYRVSQDQVVFLVLIDVLLSFLRDLFYSLPHPQFNAYGLPAATFSYLAILFSLYLINRLILRRDLLLSLYVVIASTFPIVLLTHLVVYEILSRSGVLSAFGWVYLVVWFGWLAAILYRAVSLFVAAQKLKALFSVPVFFAVWILPGWLLLGNVHYWYPGDTGSEHKDPYAKYRKLDVEAMYYSQPALLNKSLASLKPQREGKTDLYFVGFAGWAHQDVFLKEARFVRNLFDQRFATRDRSLLLINNLDTYKETPLATGTNLQRALKQIGNKMNREEDILVLFLTSHGSRSHELSVYFWPMRLNDVTPAALKQYLDDAGIKWRVLFVSSCYSGGFVTALRDENTFIATASAADRKSFGCADENDFTYFGEAYFQQQLTKSDSFIKAFGLASQAITKREQQEHITPSMPQLFVGEKIRPRLVELENRLADIQRPYRPLAGKVNDKATCQSQQTACD